MVKVYFESDNYSEIIAVFDTEELYTQCLPALEYMAANNGYMVTESVEKEELENLIR